MDKMKLLNIAETLMWLVLAIFFAIATTASSIFSTNFGMFKVYLGDKAASLISFMGCHFPAVLLRPFRA
jgi:hypothetical protein